MSKTYPSWILKKNDNVVILWHHYEKGIFFKNTNKNRIFDVAVHTIWRHKENLSVTAVETNTTYNIYCQTVAIDYVDELDCV